MENYEQKYKEALERAKYLKENTDSIGALDVSTCFEEIFPELKESDDEKIRKALIRSFTNQHSSNFPTADGFTREQILAWLEKQDKHAKFRESIQVGDHVTKNEAGDLVNLSQLEWVAKMRTEQKFKVGDFVVPKDGINFSNGAHIAQIVNITNDGQHYLDTDTWVYDEFVRLWTIQDAKDGDVLYCKKDDVEIIVMYLGTNIHNNVDSYCRYNSKLGFNTYITNVLDAERDFITPATKEQREFLFSKIKESGLKWDAEKKELKEIDQKPVDLPKSENYDIDGLYYAINILENTLGKVEGYQSDDGILEHKAAIDAVKKLYDLKHNTKKPYPENLDKAIDLYYYSYGNGKNGFDNLSLENFRDIVKIFIEDYGNSVDVEWSEEDEEVLNNIITAFKRIGENCEHYFSPDTAKVFEKTLKSLKDKIQPKQEWSEEDKEMLNNCIGLMQEIDCTQEEQNWLKSLKPHWKPSEYDISLLEEIAGNIRNNIRPFCSEVSALEDLINNIKTL